MLFRSAILTLIVSCYVISAIPRNEWTVENRIIKRGIENGIANFTVRLGKLLHEGSEGKNVLYSPLSILNALALLHLAAKGAIRDELADTLGFQKSAALTRANHQFFREVLNAVKKSKNTTAELATGVFLQKGFQIKKKYLRNVKKFYDSEVKNLDFYSSAGTDFINDWVSEKTKGHIPRLCPDPLSRDTTLVLTAALYFCGNWFYPFSRELTHSAKFNTGSETKKVDTMSKLEIIPYMDNPTQEFTAVGLEYDDKEFAMYVVLPYKTQTLAHVIDNLQPHHLQEIVDTANNNTECVDYLIPKFKYSWSENVNSQFIGLGLGKLFTSPDLKRMTSKNLEVSEIKHATDIAVVEEGTVATAVTTSALESATDNEFHSPDLKRMMSEQWSVFQSWDTLQTSNLTFTHQRQVTEMDPSSSDPAAYKFYIDQPVCLARNFYPTT